MTNKQRLERHIETIARWIICSERVVAFTGAGISTDSGIPDFRGPDGVWTRRDTGLPAPRWRVPPGEVEPNASHLALVELQRLGKPRFLIPGQPGRDALRSSVSAAGMDGISEVIPPATERVKRVLEEQPNRF